MRGARPLQHNDAQIGLAAGCETDRENGHRPYTSLRFCAGQWKIAANQAALDALETVRRNGTGSM
jgi:hypothetical protein